MKIYIPEYYSEKEGRLKGGGREIDVITIVLGESLDGKMRKVHCSLCGVPMFQYIGKIVKIYPGEVPTAIPVIYRCTRPDCGQNYLVEKILPRQIFPW